MREHPPQWREWVARGHRLARQKSKTIWDLGDLVLEVAPNAPEDSWLISDFAEAIGLAKVTLQRYRAVSAAWPPGVRVVPGVGWETHYELRYLQDKSLLRKLYEDWPRGGNRITHEKILAKLRRYDFGYAANGSRRAVMPIGQLIRRLRARATYLTRDLADIELLDLDEDDQARIEDTLQEIERCIERARDHMYLPA